MKSKDFSTTWPNLFSPTFTTVGEFWRLLQSFFLSRFSQHGLLPKSQTRHPARARARLHPPHMLFDISNFYKILPVLQIFITESR